MSGPRSRRRPYPYDIVWEHESDKWGFMLGKSSEDAPLIATKPNDMSNVAPTDYSYSAQNPIFERTAAIDDLSLGFGQKEQVSFTDKRYYYADGVNCSIAGLWIKGPYVGTETSTETDSTNGIIKFFELGSTLYALCGNRILMRTSDTDWGETAGTHWHFGSGEVAMDVLVHKQNAADSTEYAYIAMGDSDEVYRFDGTKLIQHNIAYHESGDTSKKLYARYWAKVGNEIYRANDGNQLSKVNEDANLFDWDQWGADNQFYIGDKNYSINGLATTANGALLAFKPDGIYTLDTGGDYRVLYPFIGQAPVADGGKHWGGFLNDIYVSYGASTYVINPDFSIANVGPERLTSNDSPVRGPLTAFCSHGTFYLFAAIYNPDTASSGLMQYGAWAEEEGQGVRLPIWHGSITSLSDAPFANSKITCMFKSSIGSYTDHYRMYVGNEDGVIGWIQLPCTPNPLGCTRYLYTTTAGYLYLPIWSGGFPADRKIIKAITVVGPSMSGSDYLQIFYKTDNDSTYTQMIDDEDGGANHVDFNQSPRKKVNFDSDANAVRLGLQLKFINTATSSTPQVTGIGIHHNIKPDILLIYEFDVLADNDLLRRDNHRIRMHSEQIRDTVKTLAGLPGAVTMYFPDETSKSMNIVDYAEAIAWDERFEKWRASLHIRAVEFLVDIADGLYSDLELLTYTQMETLSAYRTLETL